MTTSGKRNLNGAAANAAAPSVSTQIHKSPVTAADKAAAAAKSGDAKSGDAAELAKRVGRLQAALKKRGLDGMIVHDPFNTFYLTGFHASLAYLLVTPASATLLVDGRYIESARAAVSHCEVALFRRVADSLDAWRKGRGPRRVGVEGCVPWSVWREFGAAMPGVELEEAGGLIQDLRIVKSASEIKKIAASAKLNDEIFEATLAHAVPGATEWDLRNFIRAESDRRGADGLSFDSIIASGPAGSMPHYSPAHAPLLGGHLLLIDMGMLLEGYCSDMTRVVGLGPKISVKMRKAYDATLEAEEAALKELGPGVKCADLHRVAVETLKKRGLHKFFTHGLGHGVGLEIHEAPRLNDVSTATLAPGMVVTVEPGVYLPGMGGVRIEDLVVVTNTGHKVLSRSPKEFRALPFG